MRPFSRAGAVLGIVAVTVLAGWVPTHPFYLTNDDVAMRLLVEGRFAAGSPPTAFVLFMHVAVGWLLASLYTAAAGVPWYDMSMLLTAGFASVALIVVWRGSLRALLLSLVLLTPIFATLQFSLAGMTCAAAGVSLAASALRRPAGESGRSICVIAGTGLFLWGTLIRWEGAVLLLGQAAVSLIAMNVVSPGRERVPARTIAAAALIAVLIPLAAALSQIAAYRQSPGWRDFPEFNYTRGTLTEYASADAPSPGMLSALRTASGWSANDLRLLRNWFFVDPWVFSLEKLRAAAGVLRADRQGAEGARMRRAVAHARSVLAETWIVVLFLTVLAWSGARPGDALVRTMGLLAVFFTAAVGVSAAFKDVPFRVYWPMLVLAAGLAFDDDAVDRRRARAVLSIAAAIGLLGVQWTGRWQQQLLREREAARVVADVSALERLSPSLVVIHADALRWESAWRPFRRFDFPSPFVAIGASAQTPPVQAALRRHSPGDPAAAVCSGDRVLLIARPPLPETLITFMKEHAGRTVSFDAVLTGETLTAWRCRE